jgi:hypothetical protein
MSIPLRDRDQASLHMLVIPATQEAEVGGSWFEAGGRQKHETLSEKQTQEVERLLSKCEALS